MQFIIDGQNIPFENGDTILTAAEKAGIRIPNLCAHKDLSPYGACRLCIVKVDGLRGYPTACTTIVSEGMKVTAHDEELKKMRQTILQLQLIEHPSGCLLCPDQKDCFTIRPRQDKAGVITGCQTCSNRDDCELKDLLEELEVTEIIDNPEYRYIPIEQKEPFIDIDYNLCVLCGRCVRVCSEIRGNDAITFVNKGEETIVSKLALKPQIEQNCDYCGSCIDVCPTGTLSSRKTKWFAQATQKFQTTCPYCSLGCQLEVGYKNQRIVSVQPAKDAKGKNTHICVNGYFGIAELPAVPDRLKKPLIVKNKGDKPIELSYEETIDYTAEKLKNFKANEVAVVVSPEINLEDAWVTQQFARTVLKTNNIIVNGFDGDQKLRRTLDSRFNSSAWQSQITEIDSADNVIVIGADIERIGGALDVRLKNSDAKIHLINTYPTRISRFGAKYYPAQKHRFTEILGNLAKSITNAITEEPKFQKYNEFKKSLVNFDENSFGSSAKEFINKKNVIIISGYPEVEAISLTADIAMLIDAKILPLYETGNFIGLCEAGCSADLLPGRKNICDDNAIAHYKDIYTDLPTNQGIQTYPELVEKIKMKEIKALWVLGGFDTVEVLDNLEFLIIQDLAMSEEAKKANVLMPTCGFAESQGTFINAEGRIQKTAKVLNPAQNVYPDWKIIADVAQKLETSDFEYKSIEDIQSSIEKYLNIEFCQQQQNLIRTENVHQDFEFEPVVKFERICNHCDQLCFETRFLPRFKSIRIREKITGFADIFPENAVYLNSLIAEKLEKADNQVKIIHNENTVLADPIFKSDYPLDSIIVKSRKLAEKLGLC